MGIKFGELGSGLMASQSLRSFNKSLLQSCMAAVAVRGNFEDVFVKLNGKKKVFLDAGFRLMDLEIRTEALRTVSYTHF